MRYFEMFAGVGGIGLGIQQAYEDLQNLFQTGESKHETKDSTSLGQSGMESKSSTGLGNPICVGFSEIDKYASQVLKYHYPNIKNYGDCTKINWAEVPDFDLLTGGSPCQDFSTAGKRAGLAGAKSSLAWEFIRALREKEPRYFIWENVKGVLSSRGGWDFANLITAFSESGYSLWWQVLNAKDFGVPQNRERIFVFGVRDGSPPEILFERGYDTKTIERFQGDISGKGYASQQDRVYSTGGVMATIPSTRTENKLNILVPILMGLDNGVKENGGVAGTLTSRDYKGVNFRDINGVLIKNEPNS